MPQLMNNNNDQSSNPLDILKSLLQSDPNNSMQNWTGTANIGANAKPQLDPYQEGVKKALKQAGEAHTMDAISQGVPTDHIVEQAKLSPNQNDPTQILSTLIASALVNKQQPETQSQAATPQAPLAQAPQAQSMSGQGMLSSLLAPQSQTPIQQQAADLTNPNHRTIIGNILNTLGNLTAINPMNAAVDSVRLNNLAKSQEIQGQKPLQPKDYLEQATKMYQNGTLQPDQLMTKFEQASQNFITQRDAYGRIQTLISQPSAAGDLGLIFSYMKILDPNSTVREGEQATAENARGIGDSVRNLYNKMTTGEKLTEKQRADFYNRSTGMFKSAESQQKKTTSEFSRLGRMNGIDPRKFIRDTGLAEEATKQDNKSTAQGVQQIGRFQVRVK